MVKRGEGTFVADEPSQPRRAERNDALREAASRYASTAISVGVGVEDAVGELEQSFSKIVREHRRKA